MSVQRGNDITIYALAVIAWVGATTFLILEMRPGGYSEYLFGIGLVASVSIIVALLAWAFAWWIGNSGGTPGAYWGAAIAASVMGVVLYILAYAGLGLFLDHEDAFLYGASLYSASMVFFFVRRQIWRFWQSLYFSLLLSAAIVLSLGIGTWAGWNVSLGLPSFHLGGDEVHGAMMTGGLIGGAVFALLIFLALSVLGRAYRSIPALFLSAVLTGLVGVATLGPGAYKAVRLLGALPGSGDTKILLIAYASGFLILGLILVWLAFRQTKFDAGQMEC